MIIPQYTQYKINTGMNIDKEEAEIIAKVLNESDNPAFIMYIYGKLQKRQLNTVKVHPLVNETMLSVIKRIGRFKDSAEILKENGIDYDNFVCSAIELSYLPL